MKAPVTYLCDERFLTTTDCRFEEALGFPRDVLLFDPALRCADGPGREQGGDGQPFTALRHLQGFLERHAPRFARAESVSLAVARAVVQAKAACAQQGISAQDYTYLYSMEFQSWYHHFVRDGLTGHLLSLATAKHPRGAGPFLCVEGEKVLSLICEGNRPGEHVQAHTGLSLEALLPSIEGECPLPLGSHEPFLVEGILGEGFESVVLKVRNQASGALAALKLGKLALAENFHALQPTLAAIGEKGISVAQYLAYDARCNGILMEFIAGEPLAVSIDRLGQQRRTLPEVLQVYAACVSSLLTLREALQLSHGDAHDANWLIDGAWPTLIDFRHSPIPFASPIYQHRDTFAMLCTLYRVVYGSPPEHRQEVKQALLQHCAYQDEHPEAFPPFDLGNPFDPLLRDFLSHSVYTPHAWTLQDIAGMVATYLAGFRLPCRQDARMDAHPGSAPSAER